MKMDKKQIALLSVGALVLGVSGYFAYKGIRKFISNIGNKDDMNSPKPPSQGNVGSTPTASTSSNPFSSKAELLAFQQWVINTKGDKTILGSGGASGFGDDGLWGRKSAQAWNKYGNEYKNVKLDTSMGGGATTTSGSGSWSSSDFSASMELKDRVEDLGYDTEDIPTINAWEWDVAGGLRFPTTYMKFYNNGVFTLEKKKNYLTDRYGKVSGNWSKVSNGWKFVIGGKTYNASYSGSGLSDKLWAILKDNGFYSKTDGKFIEFDQQPMKKRNRTQLDMGCEDLM
jgi:hypothetical protein